LIVSGGAVLFRAAAQAYKQAIVNGTKAGVGSEAAASFRKSKEMNLPEAYMILGVNDKTPWEDVLKKYKHLFEVNEKHGSFYLQSKIYRAKERIEVEIPAEVRESARANEPEPSQGTAKVEAKSEQTKE